MNTRKAVGVLLALLLALAITLPVVKASETDQATQLIFSQPIEIPGQVLPAGTYWFQCLGAGSGREVIRVFNADHTYLYATLMTVPRQRMTATSDTVVTFATKESDQSTVLKAWFFPGQLVGHEFMYPNYEDRELQASEWSVLVTPTGSYPDDEVVETGE